MSDFETLNECLIECVKAAGGSKKVGPKVWPEKTVESAQRHLLNCLNEDKAERLNPDHVLFIARLAREKGCHAYVNYIAASLSYSQPIPVEPQDEAAEFQRQFIEAAEKVSEATARMGAMAERIQSLSQVRPAAVRAVA
jgi:hypothetical protein